ncbi:hypothetical protein SAMN04488522_104231 [Pedobacter caeni]|uniref:Uncharacterized protein n=1 Tax=Pedobacter caeni TaxID=288992 RepID=A0A1M5GIA7_9SPHI|nr:hypothetical protein SAMN04488522_104231 [Pedobacter caeni]
MVSLNLANFGAGNGYFIDCPGDKIDWNVYFPADDGCFYDIRKRNYF